MTWTTERWAQIERMFLAVSDEPPARRTALLRERCGDDERLRIEVERMLAADAAGPDGFIERGVASLWLGDDPLLGTCVGAFELRERIADGGMGTVYRARRTGVDFDQEVAVKVLRLGLETPAMRGRFVRERQTLARLVHPNVARLLDGGTTGQGVPYIVMEYVDGVAIDRFAAAHELTLRARLQLFAVVCHAVQFAHQNLVVHLDLKPGNILVDGRGTPKLLDFGVAGLVDDLASEPADGALGAAAVARPMTPEYASPEQRRGDRVGTAADVYALGAVLFELLTGLRPDARGANAPLIASDAFDARVPGVGATAAARARVRSSRPHRLLRALRGDLDAIVARATAVDATQRYGSCAALADDVERHLRGFPVEANPGGWSRRLTKFVRRHALSVAVAAVAVLSLLMGIVATAHLAAIARDQRDDAAAAREHAEQAAGHARIEATSSRMIAEFLADSLLSSGALADQAERTRMLATIDRRAEQARRQHADNPHLRANLLDALGSACARLDAFAAAETLLGEAAALREREFGEHSLETALSRSSVGQLRYRQGRFAEAAELLGEAYRLHCECAPDVHTDVAQAANDLAAAERALGNIARARELHEHALALRRASGDPVLVAESLNNLAAIAPDRATAIAQLAEALRLRTEVLGPDHPLTLQCEVNFGVLNLNAGDYEAARTHLARAVERSQALATLGIDARAVALRSLAFAELQLDHVDAAAAAIAAAIDIERERFGADHVRVAAALEIRALVEERQHAAAAAVATWREVVRVRTVALSPSAIPTLLARQSLGNALVRAGEPAEATRLLVDVVAALDRLGPRAVREAAEARVSWALAREADGDLDGAERLLREAAAALPASDGAAWAAAIREHQRAFGRRHDRAVDEAGAHRR
ncbi:MAG: serine/threonine protein kinase [Planctomycetes bacterium]|nr:serine/threonine protein kinase [Planctomycetota bacterium]